MVPTDAEIIFWLVFVIVATVFTIISLCIAKKQSKDYIDASKY